MSEGRISAFIITVTLSHASSENGVELTTSCPPISVLLKRVPGSPGTVIVPLIYAIHAGSTS
jgi:hypothetical protein